MIAWFYRICPIFQVSNVTGENLDLLRSFLNLLSGRMSGQEDKPPEFQIDETYSVPVSVCVHSKCLYSYMYIEPISQQDTVYATVVFYTMKSAVLECYLPPPGSWHCSVRNVHAGGDPVQ